MKPLDLRESKALATSSEKTGLLVSKFQGTLTYVLVILDTKKQEEHFIAYQRDLVTCEVGKSNHTLPHPNFSNLRFLGQSLIDYEVVDNWCVLFLIPRISPFPG